MPLKSPESQCPVLPMRLLVNDVVWATVFSPENPSSTIPLLVVPGWGETENSTRAFAQGMAQSSRVVVTYDTLATPVSTAKPKKQRTETERKATVLAQVVEGVRSQTVDILTHSAGSADAVTAFGLLSSVKVRRLILCNPVGLIGPDSYSSLFGRFLKKNIENVVRTAKDSTLRRREMGGLVQSLRYVVHKPVAAIAEIGEISHSSLEKQLTDLHKLGVQIIIIHSVDDSGFPMERMQQRVISADHPDGFVDGFYSVSGVHDLISYIQKS